MKYILKLILLVVFIAIFSIFTYPGFTSAQTFTNEDIVFIDDCSDPDDLGFFSQCTEFNPNLPGTDAGEASASLLTTVKRAINRALGLLALIALIMLLWGGFNMIFAAGDDGKYKKGRTILKHAAIGLAFIALTWLFVSLIFRLIGLVAGGPTSGGSSNTTVNIGSSY